MSILFSGGLHANGSNEMIPITSKALHKKFKQEKYKTIRYHIILGDTEMDETIFAELSKRLSPILCIAGNPDPFLSMDNAPEDDIGIGEKVLLVNKAHPFVAYLKRGKIYTIDGIKFLVLGGTWEREQWTEQEKQDVFKLLEADNSFDFVLSHTGPQHINQRLFPHPPKVARRLRVQYEDRVISEKIKDAYKVTLENGEQVSFYEHLVALEQKAHNNRLNDEAAFLNDEIHAKIQFREWWCGHWHQNKFYYDEATRRGYQYLHGGTRLIEKQDDGIVVCGDTKKQNGESRRKVICRS